jgi:uncharacterized membrane protein
MMVVKLLWPLWGGPANSAGDWLLLVLALLPWVYLWVWLKRPTSKPTTRDWMRM